METLTLILLLGVVTLVLFAVEAFLTPGFGVAGGGGALCAVAANVLTFVHYGNTTGLIVLLATAAVVVGLLFLMGHSPVVDRAALRSTIDSTAATPEQLSVKPGDEGKALTRLALIGNALIDGKTVEVKSADGFIDEGTPVIVTRVDEALILVRRKTDTTR